MKNIFCTILKSIKATTICVIAALCLMATAKANSDEKTITVGQQQGEIIAGVGGRAIFTVTTTNIDALTLITLDNPPAGMELITEYTSDTGTETDIVIRVANSVADGDYGLTLTIDGVYEAFTLVVKPANLTYYWVTVVGGDDATDSGEYVVGEIVNIYAGTPQITGQMFARWESDDVEVIFENPGNPTTSFIMPDKDVTVIAIFGSITVEQQQGVDVISGVGGAASFFITTTNILRPVPITLNNPPTGMVLRTSTLTGIEMLIWIDVDATVPADEYPLTLTIGGVTSDIFTLVVEQVDVPVESVEIELVGVITDRDGVQLRATVLPQGANQGVTWEITNGNEFARIDPTTGRLTPIANGTVTVVATSVEDTDISGTIDVTIDLGPSITVGTQQDIAIAGENSSVTYDVILTGFDSQIEIWFTTIIPPTGITINHPNYLLEPDATTITIDVLPSAQEGTYYLSVGVMPNLDITSNVFTLEVKPHGYIAVEKIEITPVSDLITEPTQLVATVTPDNSTNKEFTWSITPGDGNASIDQTGMLTPLADGQVTVRVEMTEYPHIFDEITVQVRKTYEVTVTGGTADGELFYAGQTVTITAGTPPEFHRFGSWTTDDDVNFGNANDQNTTFKMPTPAHPVTVTANFVPILVETITVTGSGGVTEITKFNTPLLMMATVLPENALDKTVTWSLQPGGNATLSSDGILTINPDRFTGSVTVRATANDGSGVVGDRIITIAITPVFYKVDVLGGEAVGGELVGSDRYFSAGSTVNIEADQVSPGSRFSNWETTASNLTINDANSETASFTMPPANVFVYANIVPIPVESISLAGADDEASITAINSPLQIMATVMPEDALDKTINWSVEPTGIATISSSGLLTVNAGIFDGEVTVIATSANDPEITDRMTVTINIPPAYRVTVNGGTVDGGDEYFAPGDEVRITANAPQAGQQFKEWTSTSDGVNLGAQATNEKANFTMPDNDVTVTATFEPILVSSITVSGAGGVSSITEANATLQMQATVEPQDANPAVTWSITSGDEYASINPTGVLTPAAGSPVIGQVVVRATANDGSDKFGEVTVHINIQMFYDVTIVTGGSGSGEANASPASSAAGGTVNLTATPSGESKFVRWEVVEPASLNINNPTSPSASFNMPASNVTITAIFDEDEEDEPVTPFFVTIEVFPPEGGSVTGEDEYEPDETAIVIADAYSGWMFAGWYDEEGELISYENEHSFPVTSDITIVAKFFEMKVWIETSGGFFTINDSEESLKPYFEFFEIGESITVQAVEKPGFIFLHWEITNTIDGTSEQIPGKEHTFTFEGPIHLEAIFEIDETHEFPPYFVTINVEPADGGTFEISDDKGAFDPTIDNCYPLEYGDDYLLTATPNEGWTFVRWAIETLYHEEPDNWDRFTDEFSFGLSKFDYGRVTEIFITAHFKEDDDDDDDEPVITISVQPEPTTTVTEGSITGSLSVEASATPNVSLTYQWFSNETESSEGGTEIEGATEASFTIPETLTVGTYYYFCEVSAEGATPVLSEVATVVVEADDYEPTFLVEVFSYPYFESGVVTGGGEYQPGETVTVKATANPGWTFEYWDSYNEEEDEWQVLSDDAEYEFDVEGDISLRANFELIDGFYLVSFSVPDGQGSIEAKVDNVAISNNAAVETGSEIVFTVTPNAGMRVDYWTINGEVVDPYDFDEEEGEDEDFNPNVLVFEIDDEDIEVEVYFTIHTSVELPYVVETPLRAWIRDGMFHIGGLSSGEMFNIYSITGALVYSGVASGEEVHISLPVSSGMYIVQQGSRTTRVIYDR